VNRIVIVGGGTAGWLAACLVAARAPGLSVTLVESPDVPTIGVGEGTWPTMRRTLGRIGISEAEFLLECDASFKQGSKFTGWGTGAADDAYFHPFTAPIDGEPREVVAAWQAQVGRPFADAVSAQPAACALDLAPRQRAMPDYAGALNYAYHLDAGKLPRCSPATPPRASACAMSVIMSSPSRRRKTATSPRSSPAPQAISPATCSSIAPAMPRC
jgi:tryptophan halogenase